MAGEPELHKRSMSCLGCGGSLADDLSENRCPACGRPFDPGEPTTYREQEAKGQAGERRSFRIVMIAFVLTPVAFVLAVGFGGIAVRGR